MAYVNPLHPPVPASQHSQFSTLGGAVKPTAAQTASAFISPFRRRVPQPPYTPASKWRAATGRTNQVHSAITFDYVGYSKQGVPMRELSTRSAAALGSMIVGAGDPVLAHTGLSRITLRIIWPGYEHVDWARSIEVNTNGPITRAQLATIVSQNFARYIEKTRSEAARASEWQIGPSCIRYEHLVLIGLCNVFEDVWQADVAVDLR
ncbi:hypothetical protein LshimejAT787_0113100 [Lyophyllum shimeji]|uniref:Uncharacterized protein n=1 Tax=Lyophyllum shimeji TaxID=47721 RepID=A0A9P3PFB2_LYOSH|nr:hypothetical protein LshimejAT787_0113100 [Lyophyllum shimeji]